MSHATLLIAQPDHVAREIEISGGNATIGRAPDNTVCLEGDTNVSRYHAVIQARGEDFWLSDLGSSNGTTLNDTPVEYERKLKDGDLINVGGSSTIQFRGGAASSAFYGSSPVDAYGVAAPSVGSTGTALAQAKTGGPSPLLLFAAIGGGLVLVTVVAVVLFLKFSGGCQAAVRIISPQSGATVRGPIPVRVEAEGSKCIDRVIYQLDGQKIASSEVAPYEFVLDPDKLQDLGGGNHILTATVEDADGNKKLQSETVLLAFENGNKANAPETANADSQPSPVDQQTPVAASGLSAFDMKDMMLKLARRINSKNDYIYDREFLQQVQSRTNDYLSAGYFERARAFRDVINSSFVGEQGLDAPLGYVTAMSRSRFSPVKGRNSGSAAGLVNTDEPQGLWQIQPSLAQSTGYIGRCGTSTLADADQKCSATVASTYMKFLVVDLFSGDYVYALACFGMQPKDAAQFRDQLPPDRRDFWKVIKSPEQRDRVVRFFAAGIVGENPQKFGLSRDKSLSSLYPQK